MGHDPATLSDWKRTPRFGDQVYRLARGLVKGVELAWALPTRWFGRHASGGNRNSEHFTGFGRWRLHWS